MKDSLLKQLFENYEEYKEKEVRSDLISHDELKNRLTENKFSNFFSLQKIGESIEKREIYSLKIGKGKVKVLLWSQMHGDEPTATTALFDLFNFFISVDSFDEIRKSILSELEIHIIPMLNPDGAVRYQRENAINVDINRDALRLQCDESQILWNYARNFKTGIRV